MNDYQRGYQDAITRLEEVIGEMRGDGTLPTDFVLNGILEEVLKRFHTKG